MTMSELDASEFEIGRWRCESCDYIYSPRVGDPEHDVRAGVDWYALPLTWTCPVCGLSRECFTEA